MDENQAADEKFTKRSDNDFKTEWFSGTGCGGQHRNKHQNSARVTHIPTGIVKTAQTRSRENSLKSAMDAINEELDRLSGSSSWQKANTIRKEQIGTGERSDKRRTIRFKYDMVIDHITGKTCNTKEYMNGGMNKLW